MLHDARTSGHLGRDKTLASVRRHVYWPGMADDVARWCRQCDMCARRKPGPGRAKLPMQHVNVGVPFERVAIDILGPLPMSHEVLFKGVTCQICGGWFQRNVKLRRHHRRHHQKQAPYVAPWKSGQDFMVARQPEDRSHQPANHHQGQQSINTWKFEQDSKVKQTQSQVRRHASHHQRQPPTAVRKTEQDFQAGALAAPRSPTFRQPPPRPMMSRQPPPRSPARHPGKPLRSQITCADFTFEELMVDFGHYPSWTETCRDSLTPDIK